jgi:hypothetical protein
MYFIGCLLLSPVGIIKKKFNPIGIAKKKKIPMRRAFGVMNLLSIVFRYLVVFYY